MFTIIGGDGKEYGPVTADQVRAWITQGRANLETKAKALGSEEWRRLGDYAEFGATSSFAPPPPTPEDLPAVAAASAAAAAPELAGRGARTGAALLNALLYFLSMMPGSIYAGLRIMKEHPEIARGTILRPDQINVGALMGALVWVYVGLAVMVVLQCIFLAVYSQNIGKLVAGVRVVDANSGEPAGFGRTALVRFVVPVMLIFLLNMVPLLGFLFLVVDYGLMFREDRRCLHDLMAGTKVVKA